MAPNARKEEQGKPSVAVIGAGISGLAAAYRLRREGVGVTVFDGSSFEGGKIQTFTADGYMWEKGPNTMTEMGEPVVTQVIDELDIRDKQLIPREQKKRYIVRDGKPQLLPSGPLGFLTTGLLSPPAKLRLLAEPFLWKKKDKQAEEEEESVGNFLSRHVGKEPVEYLADPFLAGTTGSDPQSVSVRHGFPELWKMEQVGGSLFMGAFKGNKSKTKDPKYKPRTSGSFSFLTGMQTLPSALADKVGRDHIRLQSPVTGLEWSAAGDWKVTYFPGKDAKAKAETFDAVICTAPIHDLKSRINVAKAGKKYPLDFIPPVVYQPMSVLVNAFRASDVKQPLQGFGVLIPSKEAAQRSFNSLGTIFSSGMFPNRCPPGTILFTTFIGGSRHPDLAAKPTAEVQMAALADLQALVGVKADPLMTRHIFWPRAFPQYDKSYDKVLSALTKLETDLPAFYYAGNHRGGLSVGKALTSGYTAAGLVIAQLEAKKSTSNSQYATPTKPAKRK